MSKWVDNSSIKVYNRFITQVYELSTQKKERKIYE